MAIPPLRWQDRRAYWQRIHWAALRRTLDKLQIEVGVVVIYYAALLVVSLLSGGTGGMIDQALTWQLPLAAILISGGVLFLYFCNLIPAELNHGLTTQLAKHDEEASARTVEVSDLSDVAVEMLRSVGPSGEFYLMDQSGIRVIVTDGGTRFHDPQNPEARLRYEAGLQELWGGPHSSTVFGLG